MERAPGTSTNESLMKSEGNRIVTAARERNLYLRLLGALAFQHHCPNYDYLRAKLRRVLSDIDFAAYGSERNAIDKMMRELGYADQSAVTFLFGDRRKIWDNPSNGMHVDVFFDKLEINHDINFNGRLGVEEAAIPLPDKLLEKMQIVHINEKDIVDTIVLLREHKIGLNGHAPETIDAGYIAKLLSNKWGFYHTVTTNLKKVQDRLENYPELTEADRSDVSGKIQTLCAKLENEPKTLFWKLKARVGTKSKWYNDVEDVQKGV